MQTHATQEQLIDYLHRELAPGEDAALALHLGTCDACRERYDDEARLSEALRTYARATEREMPVGIRAAVFGAIEERTQPAWRAALSRWMRPAFAVPVTAALVLVAFAGYGTAHHGSGTTIDAAYYLDDHAALTSAVPFNEGNTEPAALLSTQPADGAQ
jgi:predicted anti-sigma-YlaC factor YlaD